MMASAESCFTLWTLFFAQVKTLKEKIEEEKGQDNFPVSGLKLIHAGKVMLQVAFNPP